MDTLVENVVLLVTNSTAILSYIYPTIYEKINVCWPLNVFCGLRNSVVKMTKTALKVLEHTMEFQCAAHWSGMGNIPCTAHGFSLSRTGCADH